MKVRVIKKFIDVHTKALHTAGEEMEITEERYAEIAKVGKYVEVIPEEPATNKTVETTAKTTKKKGSTE